MLALLVPAHWYVWRRLVRDVTRPGGAARRAGTVAAFVLPLTAVAALTAGRAGLPFPVQQALAWPGFLWLALLLYLVLSLLVTEAVRPFLLRRPRGRREDRGAATAAPSAGRAGGTGAAPSAGEPARDAGAGTGTAGTGATGGSAGATGGGSAAGAAPGTAPREGGCATAVAAPAGPEAPADSGTPAALASGTPDPEPREEDPAPPAPGPSRRLFVARALAVTATAVAAGTVANGAHTVLRGPAVKRVTVPLARLPRAAHGYRIAVVSDIHLGPTLGRAHAQRIVDAVNSTQPDLIAVVGDLVDGTVENLGPAAEPLARLRARHGSFFVTGNHEYFSGVEEWVEEVRELGLRPLRNERVEIAAGFDLAGVDDLAGERYGSGPDFARALGDRDRARTAVLLAHQPVMIHDAVRHGVDLQLSGHTHGGQLWPGNFLAELANPTVEGLERYGDTQLYVSRGAGAWGPPVRVGAPSDITVVQLASRDA
ncbi:metallophosphoesterase [Streptomyces sudanensis]|uniref:metallophosphoesterase n=1 Tax=Streptomyces sudanensis TaxID=436397 RepID=UPI0020CE504F|nr:metallophosphoesterase [Streptomyces sudanensis]MCP9957635.1 metallophosphoesterase [Streptomyces sudanensis]MCQ0001823.1 metallophosphoesterase [Streptomyces sudanensis]